MSLTRLSVKLRRLYRGASVIGFFLGIATQVLATALAIQDDGSATEENAVIVEQNKELFSIIDVTKGYISGLEKVDVLIRRRTSFDTVRKEHQASLVGLTRDGERFTRITIDFNAKSGQWISLDKVENVLFTREDSDGPLNYNYTNSEVVAVHHRQNRYASVGSDTPLYIGTLDQLKPTEAQFWGTAMVFDLRQLCLFPGSEAIMNEQEIERFLEGYWRTKLPIASRKLPTGNMMLEIFDQFENNGINTYQFEFDVDTQLLVAFRTEQKLADLVNPKTKSWSIDRIEWQKVGENFVPRRIRKHYPDQYSVGGHAEHGTVTVIYDLHWFSVNKEIDNSVFLATERQLNDEYEWRKRVDPKATGADSLWPKEKELTENQTKRPDKKE